MATSDIAIVGGGLVGLCAALVMQHPARRVTVLEAKNLDVPRTSGLDARSIALSASSARIFQALGIWQRLAAEATPIRFIHISSRGRWGVTRLRAEDYRLDALGYVIENHNFARVLLEAAAESKRIKLVDGAEFSALNAADPASVEYRRQGRKRRVDARLVLVADGAQSAARSALAIGHQDVDYGQSAMVFNVEVGKPQAGAAYERFTDEGPLAMLPLGGKRYACVWTVSPRRAASLGDLDDGAFGDALQACFGFRLGQLERVGERVRIALRRTRAERLHAGRCLLLGNAANALHPVAGQSFNLSLRDIACVYELFAGCDLAELDDASLAQFADEYQGLREREHRRVIGYGDGLVTLFSNRLPVFDRLRAAGLGALDLLPALKAEAAFAGMGFAFGGNRLLRGRL
jgi:2-octaprenyl-6-methoxyphenol hydroxylase